MPWVKEDLCKGCAICVKACPVEGAIEMKDRKAYIHNDVCTRCGKCMEVCPTDAIRPNSENSALRGSGRGTGAGRGSGHPMGRHRHEPGEW